MTHGKGKWALVMCMMALNSAKGGQHLHVSSRFTTSVGATGAAPLWQWVYGLTACTEMAEQYMGTTCTENGLWAHVCLNTT